MPPRGTHPPGYLRSLPFWLQSLRGQSSRQSSLFLASQFLRASIGFRRFAERFSWCGGATRCPFVLFLRSSTFWIPRLSLGAGQSLAARVRHSFSYSRIRLRPPLSSYGTSQRGSRSMISLRAISSQLG